jgi:hypothetical protein
VSHDSFSIAIKSGWPRWRRDELNKLQNGIRIKIHHRIGIPPIWDAGAAADSAVSQQVNGQAHDEAGYLAASAGV